MGNMWTDFKDIGKLVSRYATLYGQCWYLLTFVFRLIIVVTVGGSVYNEERKSFTCITNLPGCPDLCYNTYAKISHMRFWSFQLLAVTFPVVIFHFYTNYISGQVEKLKKGEKELKKTEEKKKLGKEKAESEEEDEEEKGKEKEDDHSYDFVQYDWDLQRHKQMKRERKLGKIRMKKVYVDGKLKEVPVTIQVKLGYYVSVVWRAAIEIFFIYYATVLYDLKDENCRVNPDAFTCTYHGVTSFLWMTVPTQFTCDDPSVFGACGSHFVRNEANDGWIGNVICYITRPYEKSIFLRYMQIMAIICFLLCIIEIIYIPIREVRSHEKRKQRKKVREKSKLEVTEEGIWSANSSQSDRFSIEGRSLGRTISLAKITSTFRRPGTFQF